MFYLLLILIIELFKNIVVQYYCQKKCLVKKIWMNRQKIIVIEGFAAIKIDVFFNKDLNQ